MSALWLRLNEWNNTIRISVGVKGFAYCASVISAGYTDQPILASLFFFLSLRISIYKKNNWKRKYSNSCFMFSLIPRCQDEDGMKLYSALQLLGLVNHIISPPTPSYLSGREDLTVLLLHHLLNHFVFENCIKKITFSRMKTFSDFMKWNKRPRV